MREVLPVRMHGMLLSHFKNRGEFLITLWWVSHKYFIMWFTHFLLFPSYYRLICICLVVRTLAVISVIYYYSATKRSLLPNRGITAPRNCSSSWKWFSCKVSNSFCNTSWGTCNQITTTIFYALLIAQFLTVNQQLMRSKHIWIEKRPTLQPVPLSSAKRVSLKFLSSS